MIKHHIKDRINWIDYGKGIAILAVLLNHWHLIFYTNKLIVSHTIFAVPLFILIASITSPISLSYQRRISAQYTLNRLKKILIPYFLATLIYQIYDNNFLFDWEKFFNSISLSSIIY